MRNLEKQYDVIYTDLDNTLIYGFMTDLMDLTWKHFKNQIIAEILMYIQAVFKLYKTNNKLIYQIKKSGLPVVIMTARKPSPATRMIVQELDFTDQSMALWEMESYFPSTDKIDAIMDSAITQGKRPILFEDNKKTLAEAVFCDIDAIDATAYYEKKVG